MNETAWYVSNNACEEGKSCSYYKHLFFIDYGEFNHTNPIYINMVRNPAHRLMSW